MKKLFAILLIAGALFTSCANDKDFVDNKGVTFTAEPYGWANSDENKIDTVVYEVNVGNVVWSVIGSETLVIPIWLTGWEIMEPKRLKSAREYDKHN